MDYLFSVHPLGSIHFFRKIYFLGLTSGCAMYIPTLMYVYGGWGETRLCDRVLRTYHTMRATAFLCELPIRLLLVRRLTQAKDREDRQAVVERLIDIMNSRCWVWNQAAGILNYLIFAFALVFSLAGSHCSATSPMLYRMMIINIVVFVTHMVCSCIWLREVTREDADEAVMWKRGIGIERIRALTKTIIITKSDIDTYTDNETDTDGTSGSHLRAPLVIDGVRLTSLDCSVCFGEYESGESVRVLPCQHAYHSKCIDPWLQRNKKCAICQRDIDQPIKTSDIDIIKPSHSHTLQPHTHQPQQTIIVGAAVTRETNQQNGNDDESRTHTSHPDAPAASAVRVDAGEVDTGNVDSTPTVLSLRGRRAVGRTSPRVYSTASSIETPLLSAEESALLEMIESTAADNTTGSSSGTNSRSDSHNDSRGGNTDTNTNTLGGLTHKGIPVKVKPATLTGATQSAPVLTTPIAASSSTSSSTSSFAPSSSARELSPSRLAYASSRLASSSGWRAELAAWGEEWAEEESLTGAGGHGDNQKDNQQEPTEENKQTEPDDNTHQQQYLDRLVAQWQREEEEADQQPHEQDGE